MTKTDKFVQFAAAVANNPQCGYSQINRWAPDYDCSSLMYACGYYAGYPLKDYDPRYTGTMINDFSAVGFRVDAFDGNLYDLERGDILLNVHHHTAVYIGDGKIVEASIDENGDIVGKQTGDQTGAEIHIRSIYNYPWTHVLTPPKENTTTEYNPVSKDVKTMPLEDAITRIAIETINGGFGNYPSRAENIYNAVQKRVNELINGK